MEDDRVDGHLRDFPPPLHPPWSVPSRVDRRTAPMRTHSIIIRQRSNTTYLLSTWPQVVAQQFGTAQKLCANCGCGRTPCLRIRKKTWRLEVSKTPLPRLLLPTRASSYASERRRQEEVTNERTEGRATEARLEDRVSERANRGRNERPRFAIRGQGRVGRAVPPFLPSSSFPRAFLYPKVVTTT